MPNIKNIIFDLGGPIIEINYQLTSKAFKNLGALDFDMVYSQAKQTNLFDLYETGKIPSETFRQELKAMLNIQHITNPQFDSAWSAMVIDLPKDRLAYVKELGKKYRTFLYSNTNEIHITEATKMMKNNCNIECLNPFFEKVYFSHIFGYRKPHPESFLKLLADKKLLAKETLFIDDTAQHIEGAKKAGLNVMHLVNNVTIYDIPEYIARLGIQV